MKILAIDPGNTESAYVILDEKLKPIEFGKMLNITIIEMIYRKGWQDITDVAIEMIASYGMAVGKEVFDTCVWIGKFSEALHVVLFPRVKYIFRKDEKMNLCNSMKANDSNIRQALIDRFGPVGVIKNKGWFYGVSKDVWAAIAVGVTYNDLYLKNKGENQYV